LTVINIKLLSTFCCLIFLLSIPFVLLKANNYNLKENNEYLGKNTEVLTEVLRGAGLGFEDASKAAKAFANAYPPEMLSEKSYLIMPPLGKEINLFAVNIDDFEAVLITKKNKKFIAYITSFDDAKKIVSSKTGGLSNIDTILLLEESKKLDKENFGDLKEIEVIFDKGSTLFGKLYLNHGKKNEIRQAVREFKKIYNPAKIKIGTEGKIFISINDKLLAFYVKLDKARYLITVKTPTGYQAEILNNKKLTEKINKIHTKKNKGYSGINVTKISLFNGKHLQIKELEIKKGSNLYLTLKNTKIASSEINKLINKIEKVYNIKKVNVGQKIKVVFLKDKLFGFAIKLNNIKELQLVSSFGDFKIYLYEKSFKKKLMYTKINIEKNLYIDAQKNNLPTEIFIELVKLLSYSIDFQRDIKPLSKFELIYENLYDYKNSFIMPGDIIFSKVILEKKTFLEMFKFNLGEVEYDYFDREGNSIRKKLMRTPIDGARLSSGFGNRRHPILGYNKMHKGVDFAAKKGTPILAAGDGIVERANKYGGYGNYIRIKHNSEYKTAYAHLFKFAKGIKKGKYVKQGSIIGYVGSSGRSTGPHLHYEIILNNRQVNPYKLKLPEGKKLNKKLLKDFEKHKEKILMQYKQFNDF